MPSSPKELFYFSSGLLGTDLAIIVARFFNPKPLPLLCEVVDCELVCELASPTVVSIITAALSASREFDLLEASGTFSDGTCTGFASGGLFLLLSIAGEVAWLDDVVLAPVLDLARSEARSLAPRPSPPRVFETQFFFIRVFPRHPSSLRTKTTNTHAHTQTNKLFT